MKISKSVNRDKSYLSTVPKFKYLLWDMAVQIIQSWK